VLSRARCGASIVAYWIAVLGIREVGIRARKHRGRGLNRIQPVTTGKDAAMSNRKRVLSTGIIAALLTAAPVGNFTDAGSRLGGPLAVDLAYNTFPPEHLNNAYGQIHILGEDQGLPNEALSSFGVN